jgi:3-dehydroquinate dehydratase/shikimate dehydrogenase
MICVSIGRGRHKVMIAEHARVASDGIGLVELRLDYIQRSVSLPRLLQNKPCPVIVTCRRESDGGRWKHSEQDRITLLRTAIAEQVEYVDLEADIADHIPRFGPTKRIISMHDFVRTPEDLESVRNKLASYDADIVKIATMANTPHDNIRMLHLVQTSDIPVVGICMGEMGIPTRVLGPQYGAPFTFSTYSQERSLAPGQLSYKVMQNIYAVDDINEETEVYGVIGDPIGHTLSPVLHNSCFRHLNLNKVYLPFRVPAEDLDAFMADCRALNVKGLSVTIPHKEQVLEYCTKIDGAVKGIGAANTILCHDKEILGLNTDYRAAMACLDERLGTAERKTPLAGHTALVLGAGGAARALAFGLRRRGADVAIAGRTPQRAERLAEELHCRTIPWEHRHKIQAEVIVNATPVGMHPNVDETPYDAHYLKPSTLVFDTVYNPEHTLLLKEARHRSCKTISGVEMFVGQAALQFQRFTGQEPPIEVMQESLRRTIGAARY